MASTDPFADLTPTPYTADRPYWSAPEATYADDLNAPQPTGDLADGGSYGDIPQAANAIFTEHNDAPPNSVPAAMAPADCCYTMPDAGSPDTFPHKDSD